MPAPQLPTGLDPVTAGRFGLWLLGKRSHARAQRRSVSASRVPGCGIAHRFVALIAPWSVHEYPGRDRILPALCEVSIETARDWLYRDRMLPPKHARRMAEIARQRAVEFEDVAKALDQHAAEREAINAKPRGFMTGQRTQGG